MRGEKKWCFRVEVVSSAIDVKQKKSTSARGTQ